MAPQVQIDTGFHHLVEIRQTFYNDSENPEKLL